MDELNIEILDPGVDAVQVAATAACCKAGPTPLVREPEPEE